MLEIACIGVGALGASIGLLSGIFLAKKLGISPTVGQLKQALEINEAYYKQIISRLKGRMKEYEQPTELQQIAQQAIGANPQDAISMLVANIGAIKGIPRWLRPFIPAIQQYIAENPDKVMALINKFINQYGKGTKAEEGGSSL